MENKKSFILYADLLHTVSKMPSDKAGDLFKHILKYVNDEDPQTEDLIVELTFEPIKQQLKRDLDKWEEKKGKQSEKGKEGNLKRWNIELYNEYKKGKYTLEEAELIAKSRKASLPDKPDSHTIAKIAVNDNVSVNVNDNVIKKEYNNSLDVPKVFSEGIEKCYSQIVGLFPDSTKPKTNVDVSKWKDEIRKLVDIEKVDFYTIVQVCNKARSDSFWKGNFLTITKLRKKNKEQIKYIHVFIEKFKVKTLEQSKKDTRKTTFASPII